MFDRPFRCFKAYAQRFLREEKGGIDDYVAKAVLLFVVVAGIGAMTAAGNTVTQHLDTIVQRFVTQTSN